MDDVDDAYRMNSDPLVTQYTGDGGVVSRKEIERRLREDVLSDYEKYGYGRMAVILKEENRFIGFAGLKYLPEDNEVDLGYRLEQNYWGKGLATEAADVCVEFGFRNLKLDNITAMVIPENIGSIRVLEKLRVRFVEQGVDKGIPVNKYFIDHEMYKS